MRPDPPPATGPAPREAILHIGVDLDGNARFTMRKTRKNIIILQFFRRIVKVIGGYLLVGAEARIGPGARTRKGGGMSRKMIPVEESFVEWRKDPAYREAHDALEGEFVLAAALVEARSHADISQEEIAGRMHTSQPAVARLEGGYGNPSLNTLRRYAAATGTRLRIVFEPSGAPTP
jgi:DNA-binding XRE family transcriptional regulator